MPKSKIIPYLEVLFAVIVWGGSFIATKFALRDVSPVTVVWLRFAMGVVILAAAVAARRQFAWPSRRDALYFAGLGFLGITFHQWLQSTGLQTSAATTTAWIVASTPVFMALLGWLVLKEKLSGLQALGVGLAAFGVLLVVTKGDFAAMLHGRFGEPGDILVMISAPNWAIFSILSRWGLKRYPAARMMLYVMGFGWLFTTLLLWAGPGLSEIPQLTASGWTGVIFLGVACSGLAYIFWYDGLQVIPSAQIGAFLNLEPLVAMVASGILLQEPVLLAAVLGGAAILLGVWLVQRA